MLGQIVKMEFYVRPCVMSRNVWDNLAHENHLQSQQKFSPETSVMGRGFLSSTANE